MSNKTVIPFGDPLAMSIQAAGLMASNFQRHTVFSKLTGAMPNDVEWATNSLKLQTSVHKPIVRSIDLGKNMGDEVKFHLLQPSKAKPIMGDRKAEGRGSRLAMTGDRLRVNQARFPVDLGGVMTNIRSPYDLHKLGKPVAQNLMERYVDQTIQVQLAGARGFQENINWVVPLDTDPDFAEIMVNPVRPPTANRHFMADGTNGIQAFTVNAGEVDLATTDQLRMATIDGLRSWQDNAVLPLPGVILEGDNGVSAESPMQVFLATPAQYNGFVQDPNFRQFQAAAMARASKSNNHPLFTSEAGLWGNILILKLARPIRFYAGDPIEYFDGAGAIQTANVPAAFGNNFAVDRGILLGGQSMAEAFGRSHLSGIPFFWNEEQLDHKNALEVMIGTIRGVSKIQYDVNVAPGVYEETDNGVAVVDSVVPIIGRN